MGDGVLRIVERPTPSGSRRVRLTWSAAGLADREAETEIDVRIDPADAEKVRWYLEDYAEFPADPAPTIAADTERLLGDLGKALFRGVFNPHGAGSDAATIWAQATLAGPAGLRVEIDTDPDDAPGLPWELLRDPATDQPLVQATRELVRVHRRTATAVSLPAPTEGTLRVLLVICRPDGADDVPFRSVASRLVRRHAADLPGLQLDVLRPATFERLTDVLREARDRGAPYQVVHFDGHGTYLDSSHLPGTAPAGDPGGTRTSPLRYARPGKHGYLLFEDPTRPGNQRLVDGQELAAVLTGAGVGLLVLNACRSAYAEAQNQPTNSSEQSAAGDVHARIRAYGSLAAEIADAGVPGVVAMRYNVYVVTAADFVADFYRHLLSGQSIGHAATTARKTLAAQPVRDIAGHQVALQDWVVPTVYEPTPIPLIRPQQQAAPAGSRPQTLPAGPEAGFHGRDETLLALDRAFDTHQVVLLHALAGAGKSSTAAEFARWYQATGGLGRTPDGDPGGQVLWSSFEHHLSLDRVLDTIGDTFDPNWQAVTDPIQRRAIAVRWLGRVPVLWVWDNVEPVAGFPTGTTSDWTCAEQQELKEFLQQVRDHTQAKVLLTSRRAEESWLGALPYRVGLPPMPMRERLTLAHALAPHTGPEVDWRPLLQFTGGNPLTITVVLRQAGREHVICSRDVEAFTARLRTGLANLETDDDAAQGRTKSLAASLDYGFQHAFTDPERAALAVLHLFRDTVDVDALRIMGDPEIAGQDAVATLAALLNHSDTEARRRVGIALLDRAVEVGLLTGHGGGYYGIHPALPWYFTTLHTRHIGPPTSPTAHAVQRAYTHAYATLGRYHFRQIEAGRATEMLPVLRAEEANLRHGLDLARTHHQPDEGLGCLVGLNKLYGLTGRTGEWARLLQTVVGDYIDPATDQPRPGHDDTYSIITGYRVRAAQQRRDWRKATRLQKARTAWNQDRARPYLDTPTDQLTPTQRWLIRNLAVSEQDLGQLLREQEDPGCLAHLQAANDHAAHLHDTPAQANTAGSLGNAHLFVPALRSRPGSLDHAERWYQRALDLFDPQDRIGRAIAQGSLGTVAQERFQDALAAGEQDGQALLAHLNTARERCQQALDLLPDDHHEHRATIHNQLGNVYQRAGMTGQALHHYQQSIRHEETRGNTYGAGQTRYNIALLLQGDGRPGDALLYARAAHTNFTAVGPGAADLVARAGQLILELNG